MSERFNRFSRAISRTERLMRRLKMQGMSRFGLKGEQVQILYQLYDAQELSLKDLCARSLLDAGLVSRNLKKLCAQDIVERKGAAGKYGALFCLSQTGREIMVQADTLIDRAERTAIAGISESELAQFYETLSKLNQNLESIPGDWSKDI